MYEPPSAKVRTYHHGMDQRLMLLRIALKLTVALDMPVSFAVPLKQKMPRQVCSTMSTMI